MSNELTDVRCSCGDEYPADSYDAGFIAGSGMCQNCDAALPPKDICTCPSGDGSLRWPCPKHPAVEQVGANVGHGHVFPRADGVKMRCGGPGLCSECAADAYRARATLAQPSPAQAEQAEGFTHFPELMESVQQMDAMLKANSAQAERPEVVGSAWRNIYNNGFDHVAPFPPAPGGPVVDEPLMTVAQHAASVARWAEMFNRVEQERDAAKERADTLEHRMMGMMTRHFAEAWRNRDTQKALDGYLSAGIAQLEQERDTALARVAELEKELAMACDAAAKGDAARQQCGGMEMEIQELRENAAKLAAFAQEIISGALEGGSFDGADLQESAERHGLIAKQMMREPCRGPEEYCACAWSTSFPTECYRITAELRALLNQDKENGDHAA